MSGFKIHNPSLSIIVAAALITGSCSVEKNTLTSRTFHNITSKYNILFNGEQSYLQGLGKISDNFEDDYSGVLPVFVYGVKEEMSVADGNMDRAVEKASKLMSLHSITAKPRMKNGGTLTEKQQEFYSRKEYNSFIDDAYLLMGKAYFYKHENTLAEKIFLQVQNDFKGNPEAYESQVWLARIYDETGRFRFAGEIFSQLENNAAFPEKQLGFLYASLADYHLKQKNYPRALEYIGKALESKNSKSTRCRYLFIQAQLYEKTGDFGSSSAAYGKVISLNPPFDMAFHARINQALTYREGHGNNAEIENELKKMLRDDKYNDYLDQVYFALGDFYLVTGDSTAAIDNYMKSAAVKTGSPQQKVRTFITIADFYYNIPDYFQAQAFYDSAVSLVNSSYENYGELIKKEGSLTRLVTYLKTVTLEDSVQELAKLDRNALNAKIDDIIEKERTKRQLEQEKKEEEMLDRQYATRVAQESRSSGNSESQWYFYNETAKSLGYNEFKVVWGNRPLEDHWQRSNKTAYAFAQENTSAETPGAEVNVNTAAASGNPLSRDYYMAAIPLTDSALAASHARLENALFESALIYMNELDDPGRATAAFKELISRYPSSAQVLPSYYNLYTISKEEGNLSMEEYYKGIITGRYPETPYAMVLNNPDYARQMEDNRQKAEAYYEDTYAVYTQGNFPEVISRAAYAKENFEDEGLLQRFYYLAVLSKGGGSDRETFRKDLLSFASQYPGTEVAENALMIAGYIEREVPEIAEKAVQEKITELYSFDPSSAHDFIYLIDRGGNYNQLIFNIINFNLDNFDKPGLTVEMVNFTPQQNIVVVKGLDGQEEALQYMNRITGSQAVTKDIPGVSTETFIISDSNLNALLKDKSVARYMQFFNEKYR